MIFISIMLVIFRFILSVLLILYQVLLIWNQLLNFCLTGVSLLDNNDYTLNLDDITNIVTSLEVYSTFERVYAINENREYDSGIQSTLTYLRDLENTLKRNDIQNVNISFSI